MFGILSIKSAVGVFFSTFPISPGFHPLLMGSV